MCCSVRYGALYAVTAVWLTLLGSAWWRLSVYKSTPGTVAVTASNPQSASEWPRASLLPRDTSRPTFVLFAHPHCPCTRATLRELERALAGRSDSVRAYVVFIVPSGVPTGWEKTDIWSAADAIPGVRVVRDVGGVEAARFGAATSGQGFLFAADGRQRFSGGLTVSRSHEGDNTGRDMLISLLRPDAPEPVRPSVFPVFGCSLGSKPARREGESR
jgi:hypothetical protein